MFGIKVVKGLLIQKLLWGFGGSRRSCPACSAMQIGWENKIENSFRAFAGRSTMGGSDGTAYRKVKIA